MSVITRMRRQTAVYWERLTADTYGRFSYAAPVEIDCRWDDRQDEFRNSQGEKLLSQAVVYPDRVLKLGDRLKKGALESDTVTDPIEDREAFEVQSFQQIPNFKATETLFIAHL